MLDEIALKRCRVRPAIVMLAVMTLITGLLLLLSGILFYLLHAFGVVPDNRHTFFIPLFVMLSGCVMLAAGIICWYLYFILEQVCHVPSFVVKKNVYPSATSDK